MRGIIILNLLLMIGYTIKQLILVNLTNSKAATHAPN
jgi:hypothetical protein